MSNKKKQIRQQFRDAVFKRDGYKCRVCGNSGQLDAHHIIDRTEMPSGGYVKENGICLCPECHEKAELYHQSEKTKWHLNMHPNDLFKLIGSSQELAIKASEKL